MNTTDFINIASAICADKPFIIFEGKKHTFSEVNERVNRLSNAFAKLGLKKGDFVAILQVNCPQYIETYYACAKAGLVMAPLNFRAKADEISYMLTFSEAKAILAGDRYVDMLRSIKPEVPNVKHFISLDKKVDGMLFVEDLIKSAPADENLAEIGDDDVTILMFTAGTTGRPKAVPLRHNAFVAYALDNVEPANPDFSEVNLLTVPLYHVAGIQAMMAATYGGRTLAIMRQFEVKEWMATVQKEKANRAMLVPTMLKWVIDDPDFSKYDLSSLKVVTYGAASMPFEVIKKAIEVMPKVKFINAFGQTETASTITMLGPEDHDLSGTPQEKEKKLRRLQSSIGRAMADVQIRIVDEHGKPVPIGTTGEIVAKGSRVMSGYWKDKEKTAKAIDKDGWLHTSDMGYLDDEGYIYLAGRGDDMIIRGGENISPEEVEQAIQSYPKVEEAGVIGVPDPTWGQEVKAVVALKKGQKATPGEILEHCKVKLSSFKVPKAVVFVDALPRNPMGKLVRKDLRAQYGKTL